MSTLASTSEPLSRVSVLFVVTVTLERLTVGDRRSVGRTESNDGVPNV